MYVCSRWSDVDYDGDYDNDNNVNAATDDDDINVALHIIWIITYSLDKVILGHIQATGIHSACTKAFPKQVYIIPLHIPKS